MSTRRGGLGRGIGSLIPSGPREPDRDPAADTSGPQESGSTPSATTSAGTGAAEETGRPGGPGATEPQLAEVPGARFAELAVGDITTNPQQPRTVFDDDALEELTHSVREFGVLQPVVVRPHEGGYQLVMGERRLRAVQAAGLATIPAVVRDTDDDALLRDALLENLHRAQLNPLEEAAAYQQLLTEFDTTHDELAHRIGRSRSQVTNTIRLMNLPVPVQRRVAAGVLSAGHARALLGLDNVEAQDELAARIVAEGLSVRATEELVALSGRDAPAKGRRTPPRRFTAPGATELAENLSDAFDTRVKVDFGRRKGRITVEFASIDDLERIVGIMAPTLATRRAEATTATGDVHSGDDQAGDGPSSVSSPSSVSAPSDRP